MDITDCTGCPCLNNDYECNIGYDIHYDQIIYQKLGLKHKWMTYSKECGLLQILISDNPPIIPTKIIGAEIYGDK